MSIFLPIFTNGRPVADISTSLPGGPTACEASAEFDRRSVTSMDDVRIAGIDLEQDAR